MAVKEILKAPMHPFFYGASFGPELASAGFSAGEEAALLVDEAWVSANTAEMDCEIDTEVFFAPEFIEGIRCGMLAYKSSQRSVA